MHCTRSLFEDLIYVGADDRRLAMFEGVYGVPKGVSYNSYLLLDEKTVVVDTVDKAVSRVFLENLAHGLGGRDLDYVIVQHMEPDHSATLAELLLRYPNARVVCSGMAKAMIGQFFPGDIDADRIQEVKEGDSLCTGRHTLTFYTAPMVHWPEVIVTYDDVHKVLFSADAFGCFGALNGALYAHEVNYERDYLDETRRYFTNICGKYGPQVQALLKKAATLDIAMICPLHGFVWTENIGWIVEKHQLWSSYTPEETGVMLAYASIYGGTENAAQVLASKLWQRGIRVEMYDVSVTPASEVISQAFRYSHLVFASPTYNMGIFVAMEELLHDLAAHGLQNRTVAIMENGSWFPNSGKLMKEILSSMKGFTLLENTVTIRSALKQEQLCEIDALCDAIQKSIKG